ncbi:hypothetical protein [Shinella zoogloeoides]|uniref:hypothetical protein n=1 Tax=Shinella zoogloeoides TaxID=352475 RepID=UPI00273DD63D|nr:hypothetical protein [Shinella zoogloeoides]WLR94264.1 hypothetical protein Q9316_08875 [Shinella zoogloeoides]
MTQRIPSPRKPLGDADMQIDCEFVIEGPVRTLIDEIIQAGWPPAVAFAAVRNIADQQELCYREDPDPADDPA